MKNFPTIVLLWLMSVKIVFGADDWKLVWADEFNTNGPPNPANWNFERGFVRNHELQWYQPENAVCTNGLLVIEARHEHRANPNFSPNSGDWRTEREWIEYTSASLTTHRLHQFKYGKFEMRARIDTRSGSWPAFWTLGATRRLGWPAGGEIDIMEFYAGDVLANFGFSFDGQKKWLEEKNPSRKSALTGQRIFTSGRWNGIPTRLISCSMAG